MHKVLVTGGAGFIGSNFIRYSLSSCNSLNLVINLDRLSDAANSENLRDVELDPRYYFVSKRQMKSTGVEEKPPLLCFNESGM